MKQLTEYGIKHPINNGKKERYTIETSKAYIIKDNYTKSNVDIIIDFWGEGVALERAKKVKEQMEKRYNKYMSDKNE